MNATEAHKVMNIHFHRSHHQRRHRTSTTLSTGLTLLALLVALPTTAVGEGLFSNADCTEPNTTWASPPTTAITVYIQQDMGTRINTCLDPSWPSAGMNDTHAIHAVLAAMETWNRQSRTTALVYGGTINATDLAVACSAIVNKPAVFIHYQPGCPDDNNDGFCDCLTCAGQVDDKQNWCAGNVKRLRIFGDKNTVGTCFESTASDPADYADNWPYTLDGEDDNSNAPRDLVAVLTHELGHVLGLGHGNDASSYASNPFEAVMLSSKPSGRVWFRHLYPYDQDCADNTSDPNNTDRALGQRWYQWTGVNSAGTWTNTLESRSELTTTSFLSGGYLRIGDYAPPYYYGLYYEGPFRVEQAYTNGYFSFATSKASHGAAITDLHTSPVVMSPLEKGPGSGNNHRLNYVPRPASRTGYVPQLRYIRSLDFFESGFTGAYRACDPAGCGAGPSVALASHIPMVSAWDEASGNSVFAVVDTGHYDHINNPPTNHGQIALHAGFAWLTYEFTLRSAAVLSNTQLPSAPSGLPMAWGYRARTDVAPAIACAPAQVAPFEYNCLLAWVDRGIPEGHILYRFFRINPTTAAVEWRPGNAARRGTIRTASDISASFFEGEFYLAWKTKDANGTVRWARTNGGYTSWSTQSGHPVSGATGVIDPPTWLWADPSGDRERALIWTHRQ